jgi:hypothetical protein
VTALALLVQDCPQRARPGGRAASAAVGWTGTAREELKEDISPWALVP